MAMLSFQPVSGLVDFAVWDWNGAGVSTCPSCGNDANVQKVSAIHLAQSSGSRGSELSRLLALPEVHAAHVEDFHYDYDLAAGCLGVIAWLPIVLGVAVLVLALRLHEFAIVLGALAGLVPAVITGYILADRRRERARQTWLAAKSVAGAEAEVKRKSPEHQRRLERWEQAWYCHKHSHVIVPDVGKVLSPTEFKSLMNGEA